MFSKTTKYLKAKDFIRGYKMKVDIPTKNMVKKMVDSKVKKEVKGFFEILNKFGALIDGISERVKVLELEVF